MSRVLVNNLNVRDGPSTSAEKVAHFDAGLMINSGELLIQNEDKIWLRFTGEEGNKRFICVTNIDQDKYVDVEENIPGPRKVIKLPVSTGIKGIPRQIRFLDHRIKDGGSLFLCICVKGGLTNEAQCMICFDWGINTGKLRRSDGFVVCDKERWAREISIRFYTPYHGDYCFQKNNHHFWLTQNGREIFNSFGIGWHG